MTRLGLPRQLSDLAARSAAPEIATLTVRRLVDERPESLDRLVHGAEPTALAVALTRVAAASNALGRLCVTDTRALDALQALDRPVPVDADDPQALARSKHLELLRVAARDLLGLDPLEVIGASLAHMAQRVLDTALTFAPLNDPIALIGMGKLGGRELNYASDVDLLFVNAGESGDERARQLLAVAGLCFRVDPDLRPEGRAGPLARSIDSYEAYWDRWATTWEFQALIKARTIAGDARLGSRFEQSAAERVWGKTYSADELAEVRSMKLRAEAWVSGRGLGRHEIKRGPGGIRDVEFAVQLLQLVHGRHDRGIRSPSTLEALAQLAEAGYVSTHDAAVLGAAYRFLRTLEHRLQLVEEQQTHRLPTVPAARERLARVMGFEDDPSDSATARFDDALRRCQRDVRAIHERLFFRPLLEAFSSVETLVATDAVHASAVPDLAGTMSSEAVARRLSAFGFPDVARTRLAVEELAGGLTRSSRLMAQLLPLLLDWLSMTPDPDLGLLGLRNLVVRGHPRSVLVTTFRESTEAARRLCLLLGSSRTLSEEIERNPELLAILDDEVALAPLSRDALVAEAGERLRRRDEEGWHRDQLVRLRQEQHVRIAARDLLGIDDVVATAGVLSDMAEALLESALRLLAPDVPFCIVGLGRLGGSELAYASDLDVLFVHQGDDARGEAVADALLRLMHGPSPSRQVARLDLGLRPEGGQGRLSRSLLGYRSYFARWAQTWERQALVRARVVAGDRALGERFMELVGEFVWGRPWSEDDVAAIRRLKARMERERMSPREDPQFHLKLGRGSLSDVEWTVQLLQLLHGVTGTGTIDTLEQLGRRGILGSQDIGALRDAYRYCERTRNRWHLVGALPGATPPGDALPTESHQLSRLARSLGTTPSALRDDYRRVTRRARRVMERAFYGIQDAGRRPDAERGS